MSLRSVGIITAGIGLSSALTLHDRPLTDPKGEPLWCGAQEGRRMSRLPSLTGGSQLLRGSVDLGFVRSDFARAHLEASLRSLAISAIEDEAQRSVPVCESNTDAIPVVRSAIFVVARSGPP